MSDMADKRATLSQTVAPVLRGYMAERGIRGKDVAELLGRSPGYVSEHLTGRRTVGIDMIDAVAHLAGVTGLDLWHLIGRRMEDVWR